MRPRPATWCSSKPRDATFTARPFGAFFYGEFEDNFDDDKQHDKFHDRHILANQEDYEMRDDYMQFYLYQMPKINQANRTK